MTLSDEKAEYLLKEFLKARGQDKCQCGNEIGLKDFDFRNLATQWGTGFIEVQIICSLCHREIAYGQSWYPEADNKIEALEHVHRDNWEFGHGW